MTASELREHLGYWRDDNKTAAYRAALREVIKPGDHVIDLGSGTGLLGMLAVEAGAERVYAYDNGEVLGVARDLAIANGVDDRIEFRQEFTTMADLPAADVIVCDQIGGLVYDAGILEFFADAKARSLKPGGTLVPAAFDLYIAPATAVELYRNIEDWESQAGFDISSVRQLAANTEHYVQADDVTLCAPGQPIASIASSHNDRIDAERSWAITEAHTMHGLLGWFDATMSPSVQLSNHPEHEDRMSRWMNFYPLIKPLALSAGDELHVTVALAPESRRVDWQVTLNGDPGERQSTFLGRMMFKKPDPDKASETRRVELLQEAVELVATGSSVSDLYEIAKTSEVFASEKAATRWVDRLFALTTH